MKVKTAVLLMLGMAATAAMANEMGDASKLIGLKRCAMCHRKDDTGNQYGKWQSMGHAKAIETLGTDEAKAVAAKMGIDDPQTSGACLQCHSTAYWFTQEVQTEEVDVANGVTCQSCHGPGGDYWKKSVMEDHEQSIANGLIYPAKEKACTLCHNDSSPTWDPERYTSASGEKTGFDVAQAYEKIKHEIPSK